MHDQSLVIAMIRSLVLTTRRGGKIFPTFFPNRSIGDVPFEIMASRTTLRPRDAPSMRGFGGHSHRTGKKPGLARRGKGGLNGLADAPPVATLPRRGLHCSLGA